MGDGAGEAGDARGTAGAMKVVGADEGVVPPSPWFCN